MLVTWVTDPAMDNAFNKSIDMETKVDAGIAIITSLVIVLGVIVLGVVTLIVVSVIQWIRRKVIPKLIRSISKLFRRK